MYPFNVRVYGLLINEQQQILLTDEQERGYRFTKFPGGGLEYGEGLIEALKREYIEECAMEVDVISHFYTTDFFVKSAFDKSQIVSIYYKVKNITAITLHTKEVPFDFDGYGEPAQSFRWRSLDELTAEDVTFPTDKHVIDLLKKNV